MRAKIEEYVLRFEHMSWKQATIVAVVVPCGFFITGGWVCLKAYRRYQNFRFRRTLA